MTSLALITVLSSWFDATLGDEPQAGGGGRFGGDGGFGGGSGGSDDGIGWLFYMLIRLAIEVPILGVPLLIGVAVVFVLGTRRGWWKHQERTIRHASVARKQRASHAAADVLRAHDPAFDEARFLARVRIAFHKAQAAWCAQDLAPLEPFVSDGVFERFTLQLAEQRQDGWRQGMDDVDLGRLALLQVASGEHFDTVTLRVPFAAKIYRIALANGERIRGSELPRDAFHECWTFQRRRGAQTLQGAGLIEGKCPNCSASLELNRTARCNHCASLVRNGQYDWILTEITQESEWQPEDERSLPGLQAFRERDPGMNVAMLEDRASVAFWRKAAADRLGRTDPLVSVADDDLLASYAERLTPGADGLRTYGAECAVGSVRTLGVGSAAPADTAVVEVVWDALRAVVGPGHDGRRLETQRTLRRTFFVFHRPAGQRTRLDEAFTTAHCANCGAPDDAGVATTCSYCDAPRRGDRSTWLLHEIAHRWMPAGERVVAELARLRGQVGARTGSQVPSTSGLVLWMASLVHDDGRIEPRERDTLRTLAQGLGLAPRRLEELLAAAPEDEAVPQPRDVTEARVWIDHLIELTLGDGLMSSRERRFLKRAAVRMGLSKQELDRRILEARKRLFRDSKLARRLESD